MEAGHALMDALSDGERQQATIGQDLPGEQAARHRRAEGSRADWAGALSRQINPQHGIRIGWR